MNVKMNVVYTFDDGYSIITAVSLLSLLESNKKVSELNVFIVDCGISDNNKNKFIMLAKKYNRKIIFVDGKNMERKIPIKLDLLYWSFVCYVRLFFSELLPQLDRVLHIDCDTIIKDNLEDIYNIDLKGNLCAACYDCLPTAKYALGMEKQSKYYSNGLILFDLKLMRENNIQEKFVEYIMKKEGKLPHLDQDVLNVVLENKIYTLAPRYNLMTQNVIFKEKSCEFFNDDEPYYSKTELKNGLNNPAMIHIVGFKYLSKPWMQPCYHPYNKEWLTIYRETKFDSKEDLIKFKKKKYGIIREIICFLWNIGYNVPLIRNIELIFEKKNIKRKCEIYLKNNQKG